MQQHSGSANMQNIFTRVPYTYRSYSKACAGQQAYADLMLIKVYLMSEYCIRILPSVDAPVFVSIHSYN